MNRQFLWCKLLSRRIRTHVLTTENKHLKPLHQGPFPGRTTLLSSPCCLNKTAILLVQRCDIPLDCHCSQEYCHDHYQSPQKIVLVTIKQLFCSQQHWTGASSLSYHAGKGWVHLFLIVVMMILRRNMMPTIHHTCSCTYAQCCALSTTLASITTVHVQYLYLIIQRYAYYQQYKYLVHITRTTKA